MAIDDKNSVEVVIRTDPILKPVELKNIGFLQPQPVLVNCPACEAEALSTVRLEVVTCLQRLLNAAKMCKKWAGRHDINHYCSQCGCYIGRHVPIGCSERCLSRSARKMAARGSMSLKTQPTHCARQVQKSRDSFKANRAAAKAEKEAARSQQQQ